jgi:hypothetical protein
LATPFISIAPITITIFTLELKYGIYKRIRIIPFHTVMNQILVQLPCILSDKSKYQSSFFITSQREDQELELK